jgi:hypothetical protein
MSSFLPDGLTVRPLTPDDYDAMVELIAEDEEQLLGTPSRLTANDLREWLSRTNLASDSWLYEDDGRVVAVGWTDLDPNSDVGRLRI